MGNSKTGRTPVNGMDADLLADVRLVAAGDVDAFQRLVIRWHAALQVAVARRIPAALGRRIDAEDVLQQAYINAFAALGGQSAGATNPGGAPLPDQTRVRPTFDTPAGLYRWLEQIALNVLRNEGRAARQQKRDIRRERLEAGPADERYGRRGGGARPDGGGPVGEGGGRRGGGGDGRRAGGRGGGADERADDLLTRLTSGRSSPSHHLRQAEARAALLSSLARLTAEQRAVIRMRFLEGRTVAEAAAALGRNEDAIHALTYRGLKELRGRMTGLSGFLSGG